MVLKNYDKNWIKKITICNFLNHALTIILLTPGLNVVFGPNGVGKSAVLDAIRFLNQKYSKNGRYNKWSEYFPTGKGYVIIHVINPKTKKEITFKKSYNKGRAIYYFNNKRISYEKFLTYLAVRNIKISPLTIVPQGTVTEKIRSLNPSELRLYLEILTELSEEVQEFREKEQIFNETKDKMKIIKEKKSEATIQVNLLKKEYEEIQKYKALIKKKDDLYNEFFCTKVNEIKKVINQSGDQIILLQKLEEILKRRKEFVDKSLLVIKDFEEEIDKEKEKLQKEKEDLIGRKSILNYEITNKKKELKNLKQKYQNQLIKQDVLEVKIEGLNAEKISLEKEFIDSCSKNPDVDIKSKELENEIKEIETKVNELELRISVNDEKYKDLFKNLNIEDYKNLPEKIDKLQTQLEELSKDFVLLTIAIGEKESRIKNLKNALRDSKFPSFIEAFKSELDKNNIKYLGPICTYIDTLKKIGEEQAEVILDLVARIGRARLFGFLFFNEVSIQFAEKIMAKKTKKIELYLQSDKRVPTPLKKHPKSLGFLIDFLKYPKALKNLMFYLFDTYQVINTAKIGREFINEIKGSLLTFDSYRLNYKYGIKGQRPLKRERGILPYIGKGDRNLLKIELDSLENEAKAETQKLKEIVNKKSAKSKKRDEYLLHRKNYQDFDVWESKKKEILEQIETFKDTFENKESKLKHLIDIISRIESYKKKITEINEKLEDFDSQNKINQNIDKIKKEISELVKEKQEMEEYLKNDNTLKEVVLKIERVEAIKTVLTDYSIKIEGSLRLTKEKFDEFQLSIESLQKDLIIWKNKVQDGYIKQTHFDTFQLQNEINYSLREINAYNYLDLSKEEEYLEKSENLKKIQKEIQNFEKYMIIIKNQKEDIKNKWGFSFKSKIRQLEIEANEVLKDNNMKIKLKLDPVDIIEGKVYLSTDINDKTIKAKGLSGGQASMLTIAMLIAGQRLSNSAFFILDEFDMNLDPTNTKLMEQLLKINSINYQYILMTPAKNRSFIRAADHAIGLTYRNKRVETLTNKEVNLILHDG